MSKLARISTNPFAVLSASMRDSRQKIVELAEEMSLRKDSELCTRARSELTNPRRRIAAEIGWLPGVAPKKAAELVHQVSSDSKVIYDLSSVPPLAEANLVTAALEVIDAKTSPEAFTHWILKAAKADANIVIEDVVRDINEDRSVAGFSEIRNVLDVEAEIGSKKEEFKNIILNALNELDPEKLVNVMTQVLEKATKHGKEMAPHLVDEIVDSYRSRVEGFLERNSTEILGLVQDIEDNASEGELAIGQKLSTLGEKVRKWDRLAQPIQLSFESRGLDHDLSHKIAWSIRGMTVNLVNDHGMIGAVKGTVKMLDEIFAELPSVVDQLETDKSALDSLETQRNEFEQQKVEQEQEFANSIGFVAEVGAIFKNRLEINVDGVRWKNTVYPLDSITRVRWGGVRHSVNGIPTGTEYTVAFGDSYSEAIITLKKERVYSEFVDKLWKAVCARLMFQMLERLSSGERIYIGSTLVSDKGINLSKHGLFSGNEKQYHSWYDVTIGSGAGNFVIQSKSNKKYYEEFSYIATENAHILEQIIRASFKKPGGKLSNLLN